MRRVLIGVLGMVVATAVAYSAVMPRTISADTSGAIVGGQAAKPGCNNHNDGSCAAAPGTTNSYCTSMSNVPACSNAAGAPAGTCSPDKATYCADATSGGCAGASNKCK